MAQVTIHYPDNKEQKLLKDITCSECDRVIPAGQTFHKTQHGRYCQKCYKKISK